MGKVFKTLIIGIIATLFSCSSEDWSDGAMQDGEHACRLVLNVSRSDYDGAQTRASSSWTDGDCIYLLFANGDKQVAGRAVYRASSDEWTLYYNDQLPVNTPSGCKAHFFEGDCTDNGDEIALSASTAVYADSEGTYRKESGVVYVRLDLKPLTGRVRFQGEGGQKFSLIGVSRNVGYSKSTGEVKTSTDNLAAEIGNSGRTPYLYIGLANADRTLKVFYDNKRFTKQCQANVLGIGQSGYMQLPTETSYEGWDMAYVAKPVVSNLKISEIGCPTTKVYAEIASTGNGTISESGFCYGKNPSPTIKDSKAKCSTDNTNISARLVRLEEFTKYYVRAYAVNEAGINYGEEMCFETPKDETIWDGESVATSFEGGIGTKDDPILISTAAQLRLFANNVDNGNTYSGVYFMLINDIDLNDYPWDPIGSITAFNGRYTDIPFSGYFDGNGNMIKGLYVTWYPRGHYMTFHHESWGLFAGLSGVISNLAISGEINSTINYTNSFVGGQSDSKGGGHIINCINYCTFSGDYRSGGITGVLPNGHINNCVNCGLGESLKYGLCMNDNYNSPISCEHSYWIYDVVRNIGCLYAGLESSYSDTNSSFMQNSKSCLIAPDYTKDLVKELNDWVDQNNNGEVHYNRWEYEIVDGYARPRLIPE